MSSYSIFSYRILSHLLFSSLISSPLPSHPLLFPHLLFPPLLFPPLLLPPLLSSSLASSQSKFEDVLTTNRALIEGIRGTSSEDYIISAILLIRSHRNAQFVFVILLYFNFYYVWWIEVYFRCFYSLILTTEKVYWCSVMKSTIVAFSLDFYNMITV